MKAKQKYDANNHARLRQNKDKNESKKAPNVLFNDTLTYLF